MDKERELATLIFDMLMNDSTVFYGFFLAELNKGFTNNDQIPTACVCKHPSSTNIYLLFNEKFWDGLKKSEETRKNNQRQFIMQHELCHVINEHCTGAWEWLIKDKIIGNIAMDIFINQNLDWRKDMPKIEEGTKKGENMGVLPDSFPDLKLKWGEGTEYYYTELIKAKEEKKSSADKGEPNKRGQAGKGTSGDQSLDDMLEANEDVHATWDEITQGMSENEKKLLEKSIQAALKEAVASTEKARGTIPNYLKDNILSKLDIKLPVTDWKAVMRQIAGNSQKIEQYRTRKRENFRFPDSPANRTKTKPKIAFAIDSSGSMGEKELQEGFNEIHHIWKAGVFVDILSWDTEVHDVAEYKGQREVKRVCCGGTHMSSAVEYVNSHRKEYDCLIIMSDGYVENDVTTPLIPSLLVITSTGNMGVNIKCKKIQIKE